jgi:hypothetical protein
MIAPNANGLSPRSMALKPELLADLIEIFLEDCPQKQHEPVKQ